jgi:N-acetylglucosaminyldiphosphoundecaprenol N-acetyl-beta-D-mannosaminyltransferase
MNRRINEIKRLHVLSAPVDHVTMAGAINYVEALITNNRRGNYVLAVNAEKFMQLQNDLFLKSIFENASLLVPEGVGAIWGIRWIYRLPAERVPGIELMQNICRLAAEKKYGIFIFGSQEEINRKAVKKLSSLYPGIRIVGRCNGYISDNEMEKLVSDINRSKADILFVALGSPKQEEWIKEHISQLDVKICQGIGGSLDVLTGEMSRAPALFRKLPLEWLYRLIVDPKRIKRQLVIPRFLLKVFTQKRGSRPL